MHNSTEPTPEQKRVLNLMRHYKALHGDLPSLTYIYRELGYNNKSSAQYQVNALREKGLLDLVDFPTEMVRIPLVGNVSCGPAILAEENIEGYIPLEASSLRQRTAKYFFLRASGDSMNKAGINSGDFVLVRQQPTANNNDIVVALVGDDATLKKLGRTDDGVPVLVPCSTNPIHKPQYILEDLSILGIKERVITPEKGVVM